MKDSQIITLQFTEAFWVLQAFLQRKANEFGMSIEEYIQATINQNEINKSGNLVWYHGKETTDEA